VLCVQNVNGLPVPAFDVQLNTFVESTEQTIPLRKILGEIRSAFAQRRKRHFHHASWRTNISTVVAAVFRWCEDLLIGVRAQEESRTHAREHVMSGEAHRTNREGAHEGRTHMHPPIHTHMHSLIHTCVYTLTHSRTHIHTQSLSFPRAKTHTAAQEREMHTSATGSASQWCICARAARLRAAVSCTRSVFWRWRFRYLRCCLRFRRFESTDASSTELSVGSVPFCSVVSSLPSTDSVSCCAGALVEDIGCRRCVCECVSV
jgi:hypothetical protein